MTLCYSLSHSILIQFALLLTMPTRGTSTLHHLGSINGNTGASLVPELPLRAGTYLEVGSFGLYCGLTLSAYHSATGNSPLHIP